MTAVIRKKKICIVGCGAVGLYYGGRLLESELYSHAPIEVSFVMRSHRELLLRNGVYLRSPDGDVKFIPELLASRVLQLAPINKSSSTIADWLIVALKSTALLNESDDMPIRQLLYPFVGMSTNILIIMNGLGIENIFHRWFPNNNIFGGMAFICVNRIVPDASNGTDDAEQPLIIDHIAYGSLLVGHFHDKISALCSVNELWASTKLQLKVTTTDSLLHARWTKLAWNIPFSGLSLACGGVSTDIIAKDFNLRSLANSLMDETISLANKDLHYAYSSKLQSLALNEDNTSSEPKPVLKQINKDELMKYLWELTDNMGPYKTSTLIDLLSGKDLEVEYLFNKPYQRALALSSSSAISQCVSVSCQWPHIEHLVHQIIFIQRLALLKRNRGDTPVWNPTEITVS